MLKYATKKKKNEKTDCKYKINILILIDMTWCYTILYNEVTTICA